MEHSSDSVTSQSRYLASTLHEIRTPIQTIIGNIELLQETKMNGEQQEYLRQIQFSAEVLLELANNILDFTKIRSNEFKLETVPFNLRELTEQVADLFSIEAFNRGLEIICDIDLNIPPLVSGDPVRIQQIILNLIKNAVKFTNEGYIRISVKKQNRMFHFEVADTGIGISDKTKKHLFTDYYQGDISTYRKFGGTGLGLSICRDLVSVMKGSIDVKQNKNGGSIFYFEIPLQEFPSPKENFNFPEGKTQKILIVDDCVPAAKSLETLLNKIGFSNTKIQQDPKAAEKLLADAQKNNSPFTMVFIDMIMPKMDGWRFASEIKNNPDITNKPILFLLVPEGQMKQEAKMKMLDWFAGYLYKPLKLNSLLTLLHRNFKSSQAGLEELEAVEGLQKQTKSPETQEIAKGKKILIAEDHPVNRKLLETFIKKFGGEVFLAEDGEEACFMIQKHPETDLIFMDIQMPVKNGVDATIQLRNSGYKGIIIACTANNDQDDFNDYRKIGINDIIVKPFKSAAIKQILENWIAVMELPAITEINSPELSKIAVQNINNTGE